MRRIDRIGRNDRAHAIEMGSNPHREPPFFFQKPTDAIQNVAPGRVAEQISKLSEAFELMPGDSVYSGTPDNVGPVVRGDVIERHIDALRKLSVKIV